MPSAPATSSEAPKTPGGPNGRNGGPNDRHPLQSLGHGSVVTLIGQIILVGATFGARVLTVTPLGSTLYGDLALGLALSGLLSNLGSLGVPTAVARQLAHTTDLKERRALVAHALGLVLPAALITAAVIFLAADALSPLVTKGQRVPIVYQFLAAYIGFGLLTQTFTSFFQGNEDALPNSIFNQVLNPCLALAFLFLFFGPPTAVGASALALLHLQRMSLQSALTAYVIAAGFTLVATVAYTLSPLGHPWRRGDRAQEAHPTERKPSTYAALLSFSLPLALVGLATSAVGTADTLVLGALSGASPAGAYGAVLPLSRLVALAVAALGYIMIPVASRLHRVGDTVELGRSYATITKWIMLASLPFFLIFFLLPAASLTFVFGPNFLSLSGYGQAPLLLQITCIGGFAVTLLGPASSVLVGLGKLRLLVIDTFVSAAVDVGVSLALVPIWGSVGAAIAFSVATVLLPALCVLQTYYMARVHPFTLAVAKPVLATLVPGVLLVELLVGPLGVHPHGVELMALFALFFGGYLLAVPLTRSIEAGDHHLLLVVEGYLGRPLSFVRRFGRRFIPPEPAPSCPLPMAGTSTLSDSSTGGGAVPDRAPLDPTANEESLSTDLTWGPHRYGDGAGPGRGRAAVEGRFDGPPPPGRS
ncbi:MAG: oligosaccharide flippase family protein [Euryarchaeota archaeon]|nr:oligosaccharide flippase family protein [Euryarchaeota archaeon]MDE1836394.1 oligosaccharide flippase family protein [Euryarchaeota archaeon]MDE1881673.1 oligosaccharide flippase family protein [Euryarchaeota archaeon]MDE2044142.1 oligosaccharide flippase family protein [Thermoplasmata archaeon]